MATPPSLPTIAGLSWSRKKTPRFNTRVASHTSGREVRVALQAYPLYEFEAKYDGLASNGTFNFGALGPNTLQTLMGLFLQLQGQFGTFLYTDPDDNAVTGQFIADGDGVTTAFEMGRTLGGFNEPVSWVTALTNVYLNGVPQDSGFALTTPNTLAFTAAPGNGIAISADFSYAFNCRFLDDEMEFEEFMSNLWRLDSMKFRSVKSWL
jgi:hypothetical protein